MTGDRLETDTQLGLMAGMATALTLTGATTLQAAQASPIKPHLILNDLGDVLPETSGET
jgi:ribonucleotide monophosphatase NagD (HAD superfamily)